MQTKGDHVKQSMNIPNLGGEAVIHTKNDDIFMLEECDYFSTIGWVYGKFHILSILDFDGRGLNDFFISWLDFVKVPNGPYMMTKNHSFLNIKFI